MNTKTRASLAASAALAFVLTGCGATGGADGDGGDEDALTTVRIGLANPSCIAFFPIYTAIEQGFFAEEGLDVQPMVANGSAAVLQGMIAGQTELGTPAATPLINAQIEGSDIRYIANSQPGGVFALVAPTDAALTDAADLKGRVIGVSTADGGEVAFLKEVMSAAGLDEGDYEILVVGEAGQALVGFSRGDIDAYAASVDGVATIEYGGVELTDLSGDDLGHLFGNGIAATSETIADEGETIEAFARGFAAGKDAGLSDPQVVVESCREHQPQEVEDTEYVDALMGAVVSSYTPRDDSPYGQSVEEYWQRIIDSLVAAGEIPADAVQAEDLFTNEFVGAFSG